MQALTNAGHGGFDHVSIRELPIPALRAATDVRVRLTAAALNHLDLFVVKGMPGVSPDPTRPLGADGVGIIDEAGTAVTSVRAGDRVVINPGISDRSCEYCVAGEQPLCPRFGILGEHMAGTMAEYVVVPAANVRVIPDSVPDDAAAAFTLATLTAWRMVVTRARVTANDRVLIWGIGGGVAQAALRICAAIGATTWVTSSDDAKLARARAMGATEVINYRGVDVGKLVRERTGKRGVDVVIDNVGEATWTQSLGALGRGGRLVTCGGTAGPVVQTDVRRLFWNQWTIMGSTMGNDAEFDAIVGELRAGRLLPEIDSVFPLAKGRAALERLASGGQFGKVVVTIGG